MKPWCWYPFGRVFFWVGGVKNRNDNEKKHERLRRCLLARQKAGLSEALGGFINLLAKVVCLFLTFSVGVTLVVLHICNLARNASIFLSYCKT